MRIPFYCFSKENLLECQQLRYLFKLGVKITTFIYVWGVIWGNWKFGMKIWYKWTSLEVNFDFSIFQFCYKNVWNFYDLTEVLRQKTKKYQDNLQS